MQRASRAVLVALTAVVAITWAATAVAHAHDAWGDDRVSGSWLVLGERAAGGSLYPPLYDGHLYGGTRWMPIPIAAFAAAHRLGGHGYLPAKLVVYLFALALLGAFWWCSRLLGAPPDVAAALAAVLVATDVGLDATTTIAGDAPALVFSLVALGSIAAWTDDAKRFRTPTAAVAAALAVLAKLSAIWPALAIAIFLCTRSRRTAATFAALTTSLVLVFGAIVEAATHGRFLTNVHGLSIAGFGGAHALFNTAPTRLLTLSEQFAIAGLMLAPIAVAVVIARVGERKATIFDFALPVVLITTVIVLSDAGTYANHLLEPLVVILLLAGSISAISPLVLRVAIATALLVGIVTTLKPVAAETLRDLRAGDDYRYGAQIVAPSLRADRNILAEDPGIPYELDRPAVLMDSFMLPRIERKHPADVAPLLAKIRQRRFDAIVLDVPLSDAYHFVSGDLGPDVAGAVRKSYRLGSVVGGRYVYVPRA